MSYAYTVLERFLRYVQIDTQSNPDSRSFPSTDKQHQLSALLATELKAMGVSEVEHDAYGYVYGTIPANTARTVPVICFCSHVDTAPDVSGTGVKPIVHRQYQGHDIVLPDDPAQIISPKDYPYLAKKVGDDIVTASGETLLGADDKSGVAVIMDMAHYLLTHPEVKHGTIKLLFTPDEEVGRGTAHVNLQQLGADYGYTLDGGEAGDLEDETFSADGLELTIHGVSAHPGAAKGKMVNALKLAGEILAALPKTEWSPESTEGREGFVHPVQMSGIAEKATIHFIIRDFVTSHLALHAARLQQLAADVVGKYAGASLQVQVQEQYRNMKEVLELHPQVVALARKAMELNGLQVRQTPIRGGTDGSRLSFMGLPCPNIFTGMQALHSKHEWISVQDMQRSVDVLVTLVQLWEQEGT
ncbi:MAG: peptidase T [Chitinophagaceae bacterium]|nr:peptidase T [Chitinophagaceae bacterium]